MDKITITLDQQQINELLEIFSASISTGNLKFANLTTKYMNIIDNEIKNLQNQNLQKSEDQQ